MSVIQKLYKLSKIKQLIDLNENIINFELNFKITAINGESFFAAVTTQEALDSGENIDYQTVDGTISGNIVSDENIFKNYFLLLKSDKPVEVEVLTEIKEISPKQKPLPPQMMPQPHEMKPSFPNDMMVENFPKKKKKSFFTTYNIILVVIGFSICAYLGWLFYKYYTQQQIPTVVVKENNIENLLDGKINNIENLLDGKINELKHTTEKTTTNIENLLDGKINKLKENFDGTTSNIENILDGKISKLKENFDGTTSNIEKNINTLKENFDGTTSNIENILDGKIKNLKENFDGKVETIGDKLSDLNEQMKVSLTKQSDGIKSNIPLQSEGIKTSSLLSKLQNLKIKS